MLIPRVGIGHDTHRLISGKGIMLGGVFIPHDRCLHGHSDADVLLHSVIDALLGAAALGDIGEMFPDTAEENKGRDSAEMLRLAFKRVREAGWELGNLDCVILAQRPRILPHKEAISHRIAEILDVTVQQVGVKAKTGECVGPVGEELVIEALCVALIVPSMALKEKLQKVASAEVALGYEVKRQQNNPAPGVKSPVKPQPAAVTCTVKTAVSEVSGSDE